MMDAVVAWVLAHSAIVAGLVVGILDFLFGISPALQANSVLEWLYQTAKGLLGSQPPVPPAS